MRLAQLERLRQWQMILAAGVFILAGMCVPAAESQEDSGVLRSRSFKLKYITSAEAKAMLTQLRIGSELDELTDQLLIVTSSVGRDLIQATEVLSLLDRPQQTLIRVLTAGDGQPSMPSPEVLTEQVEGVVAGTLSDAPPRGTDQAVIIDTLGDSLVVIGDEAVIGKVQAAFDAWMAKNAAVKAETPPVTETGQPVEAVETAVDDTALVEVEPIEPAAPVMPEPAKTETAVAAVETPAEALKPAEAVEPTTPEKSFDQMVEELMTRYQAEPEPTDVPTDTSAAEAAAPDVVPVQVVTETEDVVVEETPMTEAVESVNDFMDEGLLSTLEAEAAARQKRLAEEKAALEAAAAEVIEKETADTAAVPVETAVAEKPAMSKAAQQRAEAIAAMQAQAAAEQNATAQAEAAANDELRKALEALLGGGATEPDATTSLSPSEQEIMRLKAEIAQLKAAQQALAESPAERPAKRGSALTGAAEAPAASEETAETKGPSETPSLTTFEEAVGEEMLETVIDLPQEVELEWLVDLVGKQLGLNYLYDANIFKTKPKVTLKIHKGQIKVKDLYALLESIMRSQDFIMTRRSNFVEIYNKAGMPKADPVLRGPNDPIQPGDILVQTVYEVQHMTAAEAQNALNAMKMSTPGVGTIQPVAGSNMLVVTDYAYRMPYISTALDLIDVAGEPKEFEYRQLKYMQAGVLAEKLKTLIGQMEGVSLSVSTTPAAPVQTRTVRTRDPNTGRMITSSVPVNTASPAAAKAAKEDGVFLDIDERTNRILMIGERADLDTLNQLIDTLDVPQQGLKYVREYIIEHVEAMDVVDVLNELALAKVSVSAPSSTTGRSVPTTASRGTPAAAAAAAPAPRPTPPTSSASAVDDQPNISVRPATNSLLVNATSEQHQAIELVIAHVDVVQKDQRTIREYEIQYVDAQEILNTMADLGMVSQESVSGSSYSGTGSSRGGSRSTSRSTPPAAAVADMPAAGAALAGLTGEEGSSITEQQPQISILEATNSLLVYATPRQHKAIAMLIGHADRVPETTTTPYVVYALENQEPGKLAGTLEQIVSARQGDQADRKSPVTSKVSGSTAASTTPTPNLPNLEEESIRIIPDEDSYSLIVSANKRNQQWISELIKQLDEYRPQVLLDCMLVEITQDESFKYDMDIVSKTYGSLTLQPGSPVGTPSSTSFSGRSLADARSTSGNYTGFFNSDMIQALLETMQTKGYGRIMSKPKILVNDNQEGQITTTNTTAVAQIKTETRVPDTGDAITSTNVDFPDYESGVDLYIKPHISKGDMLRLEIKLNRTDFTLKPDVQISTAEGDFSFPSPPDRLSTDVSTISTVPDGTTIILGGLESINQTKSHTKVPIIGDLPIVGGLFRGIDDSGSQDKLYVFVKANIIRPGDQAEGLADIRRVSGKYRAEFEEMEDNFHKLQDWPGIDPKPMDPDKVLEDDFSEDK